MSLLSSSRRAWAGAAPSRATMPPTPTVVRATCDPVRGFVSILDRIDAMRKQHEGLRVHRLEHLRDAVAKLAHEETTYVSELIRDACAAEGGDERVDGAAPRRSPTVDASASTIEFIDDVDVDRKGGAS